MTAGPLHYSDCIDSLASSQNPDGGWGFRSGASSAVEATAWALAALNLSPAGGDGARDLGRSWLLQAQRADGGWPAIPSQPQACWITSLAAGVLQRQGGAKESVERGLRWLLDAWPAEGTLWWRIRQAIFPAGEAGQNHSLRGWSWTAGTASWVEPTAHALIFLQSLPAQMLTSRAAQRMDLAEGMLFDRMCPGGGWNSGNPSIYGVPGVPRIGPTVWALLALKNRAERAEVRRSLEWLEHAYGGIHGPASLALAHLCLTAYGLPLPALGPALGTLYARNHFFDNVITTAWAAAALRGETA